MARTYTVTENTNSRKMQIQTPGAGSSVFSYEFTVRPTSGTVGTVNEEYQAAYNGLRAHLGIPIGKLTDISAYSSSPFGALGSVRSINMEIEPGSDHVYRSVVTWQSEFPAIYSSDDTDPLVISGQACLNYTSQPSLRMVDIYKSAALPSTSAQNAADTAGGLYHASYLVSAGGSNPTYNGSPVYSIDVAGRPVKFPSGQIEVVIDEPWAAKSDLVNGADLGLWPEGMGNSGFLYKRNSTEYLGFPAGSLLFMGTTTSPRQFHTHTLSHRFIYDEYQHFEQQTFQSVFGIENISTIDNAFGTTASVSTSLSVFWTNYYGLADFNHDSGGSGGFIWGNVATATQVDSGLVDWTASAYAGPITQ